VLILRTSKSYIVLFSILALFFGPASGHADAANLKFIPESSGNQLTFSLVVDHAEQIAGVKITLVYDKNFLTFKSAEKTKMTASFMHVVNDKVPGKIIIVMASAKGLSGDNVPLFHLKFTKIANSDTEKQTITVTQVQLMDEKLKEINANRPVFTF
jgi:hypothetical protein